VGDDGPTLFSSGNAVLTTENGARSRSCGASSEQPVTALCSSPGGIVGVGMADASFQRSVIKAGHGNRRVGATGGLASVSDCIFVSEDEIGDCRQRPIVIAQDICRLRPGTSRGAGRFVAINRNRNRQGSWRVACICRWGLPGAKPGWPS